MQYLISNHNNFFIKYNKLHAMCWVVRPSQLWPNTKKVIVLQDPSRSNPNLTCPNLHSRRNLHVQDPNMCLQAHQEISLFSKLQLLALLKFYLRSKCKLAYIWCSIHKLKLFSYLTTPSSILFPKLNN